MKVINDSLFKAISEFVVTNQSARTAGIQIKFMIGFNRMERVLDLMEECGIVGQKKGVYARPVLISDISHLNDVMKNLELCEQRSF